MSRLLIVLCGMCWAWNTLCLYQEAVERRRWKFFVHGLPEESKQLRKKIVSSLSAVGRAFRPMLPLPRLKMLGIKLEKAGFTSQGNIDALLGTKVVCAVLGTTVGIISGGVFLGLAISAILFFVPDLYLGSRADRRRTEVQRTLPHIIDLLVVATEAGMSFESALQIVARSNQKGTLYRELGQVLDEIRLGKSQEDALRNLSQRLEHPDVTSFVLTLVQGQKLGTPISRVLTVVAHQVRVKQAMAFEAEASKAPIKILFPVLLFIFPSLLLVLLGPVMLRGFI